MTTIDTQVDLIEAWETENGDLIVWGTHDPANAEEKATTYCQQNNWPSWPTKADWADFADKQWGDTSLPRLEQWPNELYGNIEAPGMEPFLFLGQRRHERDEAIAARHGKALSGDLPFVDRTAS